MLACKYETRVGHTVCFCIRKAVQHSVRRTCARSKTPSRLKVASSFSLHSLIVHCHVLIVLFILSSFISFSHLQFTLFSPSLVLFILSSFFSFSTNSWLTLALTVVRRQVGSRFPRYRRSGRRRSWHTGKHRRGQALQARATQTIRAAPRRHTARLGWRANTGRFAAV